MEENKVIVDRANLSSEYIAERQDFNQVLKAHRATKPSLWKSSWFYGPVGLAVIAVTVAAAKFNPSTSVENKKAYEAKITLKEEPSKITKSTPVLAQALSTPEPEPKPRPESKDIDQVVSTAHPAERKPSEKTIVEPLENKVEFEEVNGDVETETNQKTIAEESPEVREPRIAAKPGVPKIAGVFNGRIKADLICSSGVIEMNEGWYVLSYTIQYYNGIEDVIEKFNTDLIPPKLCSDLKRFNANSPVNITSIVVENLRGERKLVPSMQIIPVY